MGVRPQQRCNAAGAESLCCAVLPAPAAVIFVAMEDSKKWQVKEGALRLLVTLAQTAPTQVSLCLPAIVPLISERMVDAREQVRGQRQAAEQQQQAAGQGLAYRLPLPFPCKHATAAATAAQHT